MNYIAKCAGTNCPIKEKCYRYVIQADADQKWLPDVPYDQQKNKCSKFYGDGMMKIEKKNNG